MGQIIRSATAINTFAGAADITTSGSYLLIAGLNTNIYYPGGSASGGVKGSLIEVPTVYTYTPTVTASTLYAIVITQMNLETQNLQSYLIQAYNPATGGTATTLCNAFKAQIAKMNSTTGGGSLYVTTDAAGAATMTMTGTTGNCVFTAIVVSGGASTDLATTATYANVAIVSSTNATPIVVTTGASTWTVGQSVLIAGHTVNTAANGLWRIAATNGTTTVTLENSVGNGVGGATGTATKSPQNATQTAALLAAQYPFATGTFTSGATYAMLNWNGTQPVPTSGIDTGLANVNQLVFFNEGATNFAAMVTQLNSTLTTLGVRS